MPPHDLTYMSSDIFSTWCLQVDKGVVTTGATSQLLWMILNTFFQQMQADLFSRRLTQFVLSFTSLLESNIPKRYLIRFAM